MTGDYRSPIAQRLSDSLRLLQAGPSLDVLRELERDARDLAACLHRHTLAHERAAALAGRLRLLRVGMEAR